jgi:hypothetical protein
MTLCAPLYLLACLAGRPALFISTVSGSNCSDDVEVVQVYLVDFLIVIQTGLLVCQGVTRSVWLPAMN